MKIVEKFLSLLLLAIMILPGCNLSPLPGIHDADTIREYALEHREFTFDDVLSFEWDVAYHDTLHYGSGEVLKEKFNLEFDVEMLDLDHMYRLLFFKSGTLVKEIQYAISDMSFPYMLEVFYPDTTFYSKPRGGYSVDLSALSQVELHKKVEAQNMAYVELSEQLLQNQEVKRYIYDFNQQKMELSQIELHGIIQNEGTIWINNFVFFYYILAQRAYPGGMGIALTKVYVDGNSGEITNVESYAGEQNKAPAHSASAISDAQDSLNLQTLDLQKMLVEEGIDLHDYPSAEISLSIWNDEKTKLQCTLISKNDETLTSIWAFNEAWVVING